MAATQPVKVGDQVWIAVALLERENPKMEGFSPAEIKDRVRREFGRMQPGVPTYVSQHCIATKQPDPSRSRFLTITRPGKLRLFLQGDPYHPDREGSKTKPVAEEVPERYRYLLDWYAAKSTSATPIKTFGPDAQMLRLQPGASGHNTALPLHRGKAAEAYAWARLLQNGIVPYIPFVDLEGIDAIIKLANGRFLTLQVKSRGDGTFKPEFQEQIKALGSNGRRPFDFLIIVLFNKEGNLEAWVVPAHVVSARLSPGGDLSMSHTLMRKDWLQYHENWASLNAS